MRILTALGLALVVAPAVVSALAASFGTAARLEWKPRPDAVTSETLSSVASGKGPGRVTCP